MMAKGFEVTMQESAMTLQLRNVRHQYRDRSSTPQNYPDLSLGPRDIVLLRGASGSGKSTLLHLVVGALQLNTNHGDILVEGHSATAATQRERDALRPRVIGWVPQRVHLLHSLNVIDNVTLPLKMSLGVKPSVTGLNHAAMALLRAAGVAELAMAKPSEISVGQAARVCVVRALLAKPKLLVADEPSAALDQDSTQKIAALITDYAANDGAALVATHDEIFVQMLTAGASEATNVRQFDLSAP
jgi:putative ABC transport system ATP-binding protein